MPPPPTLPPIHRSLVTITAAQRTRTYHHCWCRRCHRMVRIASVNPYQFWCPRCLAQLRRVLDVSFLADAARLQPSLASRLFGALSQQLDLRELENENWIARRDWIVLQFPNSSRLPMGVARSARPAEIVAPQSANPREAPHRDGIEELDQEPTQNDRPSTAPAPAPESAIEALPTVNVTETHLVSDSHCPVCKEEFEVGGEARVMPCNHLYHSDCIVPWLRIQRTCPVCRYELQGFSNDDDRDGGGGDFQAANGYPLTWPRIQSVSLWPSRLFSNWMYGDDLNSQTGTMSGSRGVFSHP